MSTWAGAFMTSNDKMLDEFSEEEDVQRLSQLADQLSSLDSHGTLRDNSASAGCAPASVPGVPLAFSPPVEQTQHSTITSLAVPPGSPTALLGALSERGRPDDLPKSEHGNENYAPTCKVKTARLVYTYTELMAIRRELLALKTAAPDDLLRLFKSTPMLSREKALEEHGRTAAQRRSASRRSKKTRTADAAVITKTTSDGVVRTDDAVLTGEDADADFEQLMLPEPILHALTCCGYVRPSPVQLRAVPVGRVGVDLIAQAKSGTGKTIVFCILALETVLAASKAALGQCAHCSCLRHAAGSKDESDCADQRHACTERVRSPSVLVIEPTREIAQQVGDIADKLARKAVEERPSLDVCVRVLIGGVNIATDVDELRRGCDIAVGTPGRLHALLTRRLLDVSRVRLVVIDEADKLLEGTFSNDVPALCRALPEMKQVATFSATFSPQLIRALEKVMRNPQFVTMMENSRDENGAHSAVLKGVKLLKMLLHSRTNVVAAVQHLFATLSYTQCVIFSNQSLVRETVYRQLVANGVRVASISGNAPQSTRNAIMRDLRAGHTHVIIASDILARGVDLPHCDLVINLDVPRSAETFLHRVGRVGRFGTMGRAVTISGAQRLPTQTESRDDIALLKALEDKLQLDMDIIAPPEKTTARGERAANSNSSCSERAKGDIDPTLDAANKLALAATPQTSVASGMLRGPYVGERETARDDPDARELVSSVSESTLDVQPLQSAHATEDGRLVKSASADNESQAIELPTQIYSESWISYWQGYAEAYWPAKEAAMSFMQSQDYR